MPAMPDLDELILQIHAAPLAPEGWKAVSRSLVLLCGAERSALLRVGPDAANNTPLMISTNLDPATIQEYFSTWASHDVLYHGAIEHDRIKPTAVSTDEELVERRKYFSCAYFNDFLRKHDIGPQLNVCLTGPEPRFNVGPSALTLYRGVAKESFSRDTAAVLQRLAPHLSMAARTTWHIEALTMADPIYRQALDEIRVPLFALDMAGKLVLVNSAGSELFRTKRWVAASSNTLGASRGLLGVDAFRDALAKLRRGMGATLLLTDGVTREQAVMTTAPFASPSPIQVTNKRIAGFVWIVPCAAPVNSVSKLGQLFELTPAETRLLQRLADGETLRDAAGSLRISFNTARTHLKAIFRKSGQRTQGQLLALAQRMAAIRMND
jgi:DNA-binding CsgD family transcriptional regulator/PAS domain-containing protein